MNFIGYFLRVMPMFFSVGVYQYFLPADTWYAPSPEVNHEFLIRMFLALIVVLGFQASHALLSSAEKKEGVE